MTVRDAAGALGVAVSTAFRLRHRFLQAVQAHQPHQVSGLLEADETYFRQSQKGSRKMTRPSRGRGGKATPKGSARDLVPVLIGRVRGTRQVSDSVLTAMTAAQAEDALRDVVGPDTLLCTDGSGALRTAATKLGVTSKSIAVSYDGRVSEGVYHVQTVNKPRAVQDLGQPPAPQRVDQAPAQLPRLDAPVGVVQGRHQARALRRFRTRKAAHQHAGYFLSLSRNALVSAAAAADRRAMADS